MIFIRMRLFKEPGVWYTMHVDTTLHRQKNGNTVKQRIVPYPAQKQKTDSIKMYHLPGSDSLWYDTRIDTPALRKRIGFTLIL